MPGAAPAPCPRDDGDGQAPLSLLGPLRDMIAVREETHTYDEQRPANAPSGAQLVRLFGTWPTACAVAAGLSCASTVEHSAVFDASVTFLMRRCAWRWT
jgi:hypothetical protein